MSSIEFIRDEKDQLLCESIASCATIIINFFTLG